MAVKYDALRDTALQELRNYMDSLDEDKAAKLAYWIKDYTHFLSKEATFAPEKLIRYKRGSIVKAHLGYRIGSEEGGLHYAIVMDRKNSIYSPTVTVIPLTSVKPESDFSKLPLSKLHIENEVYSVLRTNLDAEIRTAKQLIQRLEDLTKNLNVNDTTCDASIAIAKIEAQIIPIAKQVEYCTKMKKEVSHMKTGSIALVGQITTISKIRIYDPKYKSDALSKVRVSDETLDKLDARVQELFGPQNKKSHQEP